MKNAELMAELMKYPPDAEIEITHDALMQNFSINEVRQHPAGFVLLEARAEVTSGDVETMLHYYNAQERRRAHRAIDGIVERAEADRQKRG